MNDNNDFTSNYIKIYKQLMKESLAASSYFGLTRDDYMEKIEDLFRDTYGNCMSSLDKKISDSLPKIESTDRIEILRSLSSKYDNGYKHNILNYEEFVNSALFRIPENLVIPGEEKLQESIENYSKEEYDQLEKDIDKVQASILEKQTYIQLLKERISEINFYKNMLKE